MKKKSKKNSIVKVETKLAKTMKERAQLTLVQTNKRNLAQAKMLRDNALQNLKEAVFMYSAAEAAVVRTTSSAKEDVRL